MFTSPGLDFVSGPESIIGLPLFPFRAHTRTERAHVRQKADKTPGSLASTQYAATRYIASAQAIPLNLRGCTRFDQESGGS